MHTIARVTHDSGNFVSSSIFAPFSEAFALQKFSKNQATVDEDSSFTQVSKEMIAEAKA